MQNDITKFNQIKADVVSLVESIKTTVISIPSGKTGYELMKDNRKTLGDKRVELTKMYKTEREGALNFQRMVIEAEKEVIALIKPVEDELRAKIDEIEAAEAREKRKELLPERIAKLEEIECAYNEEILLDMDEKTFAEYFVQQKGLYLEEKEHKIAAEQQRIEDERLEAIKYQEQAKAAEAARLAREAEIKAAEEAARLKAQEDAIKATEEARMASEKALQDAKLAADKAAADALAKAEAEKQAIIDENNRKELERLRLEEEKRMADEARILKENAEKEELERNKQYQKFLSDHGCTAETKDSYLARKENGVTVLYKKLGEFKYDTTQTA